MIKTPPPTTTKSPYEHIHDLILDNTVCIAKENSTPAKEKPVNWLHGPIGFLI
jgi:hypothetical protein